MVRLPRVPLSERPACRGTQEQDLRGLGESTGGGRAHSVGRLDPGQRQGRENRTLLGVRGRGMR